MSTENTRKTAQSTPPPIRTLAPEETDFISVWLSISSPRRPRSLPQFFGELAEPEFVLDTCRESACMSRGGKTPYHAHWYCRFKRVSANEFSDIRLLKRLTGATFKILRFSLVAPIEGGRAPARADEFVYM